MEQHEKEAFEREKSLCADYSFTFEGKEGEAVLGDLKDYCGANRLCFDNDPLKTAFMLGARSVYLYVQERISQESLKRMNIQMENDIEVKSKVEIQ
jgi:hypothetical protein